MGMRPLAVTVLALLVGTSVAQAAGDPLGQTTLEMRIAGGDRTQGFSFLRAIGGQPYRVRQDLATAEAARHARRRSLAHIAQLSDFQLADEESPARVEFLDQLAAEASSAQRPQEALMPYVIDASIRQVNALRHTSPVAQAGGRRRGIDFAITTGDNADSQQLNEAEWVATLLRGGPLNPNSGSSDPADYGACPDVPVETQPVYTGVQDYDDYAESTAFYDPDSPQGQYAGWPAYPGLLDRAQQPFVAAGLEVPSYVAVGNHDLLVQGNEEANAAFEAAALACRKVMAASLNSSDPSSLFAASLLTSEPQQTIQIAPDPKRRFATAPEYRALFAAGRDAHGFAFVDPAQAAASRGAANYYSFSPRPGLRMIAMDSVANGGVTFQTDRGNIDEPQFRWIEAELQKAEQRDELVIVYSHHGPQSMDAGVPDELAGPCTTPQAPESDPNPGCDLDPRDSRPRLADDMVELLHRFPHVIAWVAGHSHVNDVTAYRAPGPVPAGEGGSVPRRGFWVVRTSAEADWPHQDRLVEVMDNRDGTLSIFGTLLDNAAPTVAPAPGTAAAGLDGAQLASIGRTLGYNDPQNGGGTGESLQDPGETSPAEDQNVELLIADPRRSSADRRGEIVVAKKRSRLRVVVRPRRLRARERARLRIAVFADGRPARGARVRVGRRALRTGRGGRVTLRVRPRRRGTLRIVVRVRGRGQAVVRVPVRRARARR